MANLFPQSWNSAPLQIIVALGVLVATSGALGFYYFTKDYSTVGYEPLQPVAYNHYLHAEQLGIDCRYCHSYVDQSGHANVPDSGTCMNCHSVVKSDSPALAPIRESYESGDPVPWVRVHKVPDYVYFNHAVHVNRGISCVECHQQVNRMEVVEHAEPLSMAFCLECHRNPEKYVRDPSTVYDLDWEPKDHDEFLRQAHARVIDWNVNPPQSCSGCHR